MNLKEILDRNPIFGIIKDAAKELEIEAFVVGGFVRDLFLNRSKKDIDIVCIGSGIALAEHLAQRLDPNLQVAVFKNFGTAMLKYGEIELEFVGARKESYRRDSRKPIVEDGTLIDDQNRRDFTINAMSISLNENDYGTLYDPFDGISDLRKKIIRTPLDPMITFSDDPLRIMRAIRFASQLQFDIESTTFKAIIDTSERLDIISKERISEELNKIILCDTPSYGFKLLFTSKVLQQIFPEMTALHGVETIDGKSHKDNFYHTLQVLDNVCKVSPDLWLRWAAILHDIAKPVTKRFEPKHGWTFHNHEERGARMVPLIFRDLKLPLNEKMKFVQKLVRLHLRPIALVKEIITDSALRRLLYDAGEDLEALMMLCRADITSKNDERVKKYIANFDKVEQRLIEVEAKDKLRHFQPIITGEIIMDVFGLEPCKDVGTIKSELREAILEGEISNTPEKAVVWMFNKAISLGHQPLKTIEKVIEEINNQIITTNIS